MDALAPELTGHRDGYCVRFDDREVAVFPAWIAAAEALKTARQALVLLDDTLARSKARRIA